MLQELVHLAREALATSPTAPQPATNYAGLAALIAACAGLISAIGAIVLGFRRNREGSSPAAEKAIEYLIKQNRELLRDHDKRSKPTDAQ